jgi:hypothetical protein
MSLPKRTYHLLSFAIFACCLMLITSSVYAQGKIEMQTCEDVKIGKAQYGAFIVETAACVGPSKTFQPKDTARNVNIVATFPAVPTGAGITFLVTKNDAAGEPVQYIDYTATPQHTSAHARLTINIPGKYFVRMANYYDKSQVWATAEFSVGAATTGPNPTSGTPAGRGNVSICKEIDDNWKCVGQSDQWAANTPFNVLFENPVPVGVDFVGMVFHRQGPDGKDVAFINEFQQHIGEQNRKYATVGNELKLPAGTYSVYIIAWGKRETLEHKGNFTEYFAKTTLKVK